MTARAAADPVAGERAQNGVTGATTRRSLTGITAYGIWGLFPLYWPLLVPAGALEILAHRMVWSLVIMIGITTATRQWRTLTGLPARTYLLVVTGAVLISVNWGVYIYAVNGGQVVDAALGYFINPLISVVLGVILFGEQLRALQWVAAGLGGGAVAMIAIAGGHPPWIALILAASFGCYGLIKKVVPLAPGSSLTAEGLVLVGPALAYLGALEIHHTGTFLHNGAGHAALLAATGVITVVPLMLFAEAAQMLPLSILGLLQYLTPVVQFLIGVVALHEQMSPTRWWGFVLIWSALILLSTDGLRRARSRRAAAAGSADVSIGSA